MSHSAAFVNPPHLPTLDLCSSLLSRSISLGLWGFLRDLCNSFVHPLDFFSEHEAPGFCFKICLFPKICFLPGDRALGVPRCRLANWEPGVRGLRPQVHVSLLEVLSTASQKEEIEATELNIELVGSCNQSKMWGMFSR